MISLELGIRQLEYNGLIIAGKMTRAEANLRFCALADVGQLIKDEKPKWNTTHEQQLDELNRWLKEVRKQVGEEILQRRLGVGAGRERVAEVEGAIKFLNRLRAMSV